MSTVEVREFGYKWVIDAHINGRPVGYLALTEYDEETLFLGPILVDKEYRNQGWGTSMIIEAIELARDHNYSKLRATTEFEYVRDFFIDNKFEIIDEEDNIHGHKWIMEREV